MTDINTNKAPAAIELQALKNALTIAVDDYIKKNKNIWFKKTGLCRATNFLAELNAIDVNNQGVKNSSLVFRGIGFPILVAVNKRQARSESGRAGRQLRDRNPERQCARRGVNGFHLRDRIRMSGMESARRRNHRVLLDLRPRAGCGGHRAEE